MSVTFACPACGKELAAPDDALGIAGTCRFCGAAIISPAGPNKPAFVALPLTPPATTFIQTAAPPQPAAPSLGPGVDLGPTGRLHAGQAVREAWELVASNWGVYVGALLLAAVANGIRQSVSQQAMMQGIFNPGVWRLLDVVALLLLLPLQFGIAGIARSHYVNGTPDFGALFLGYRRWWSILVVAFFQILAIGAAVSPFIILLTRGGRITHASHLGPFDWVLIAGAALAGALANSVVVLAPMEVLDRGANPVEAFDAAFRASAGHRLELFALSLLAVPLAFAGLLACCVGLFFTMAVAQVSQFVAYRHLRGVEGADY